LIYKTTDNREKNIKDGIAILERALNVFSKEHLPHEWAIIQQNLGVAYEERIAGDRAENIQKAIEYYQAALTIETLQTNLFRCLHIANILGSLAFSQGNWQLAIEAYSIAIEAIETNRLISTDDARRQEIISESISVYTNMVQALINNGQIEQAIEYAERSRCRRLVDLMASNDLYNDGNIPPKVAEYLEEYEAKQKLIDEERNRFIDNHNGTNTRGILFPNSSQNITRAIYEESNDKIKQLESEKAKIWQKIRSLDKILSEQIQVTPIPFDDICQLIPDSQTALVYFYTTQTKIQIFVILKDKTIKLHTTDLDFAELHDFAFNSWIIPYCDDFELWKEQMPQNLEKLASNLKLSELVHSYLQDIEELIIIPHLYLHLIPFAALPILPFKKEDLEVIETSQELSENNLQKLLGERFRIRILPSAQILQFCHQRDSTSGSKTDYGMIEDADNTLPFSQYEGEQIAQIFNISDTNRLRGKTQATVNKYRELVERVQVIHSCHHAVSRLDNPLESHLVLADGTISLGSLMSPGWRLPNLKDVFLSCCETNLGITELSDDPLTLATGFLCAGARSVVSTLWKVDDLATAIFSIIYYQLRNDGLNRSTALQQTQDRLKTITGEELKQRFYDEIFQYFKTQQKLAHKQYQDCNSRLENLTRDTSEDEKTKTEKKEWNEIMNKLKNSRNWFDQVIKEDLPFAHPYYWAGFISQGLR
jgi:CHAT domain-containing protein